MLLSNAQILTKSLTEIEEKFKTIKCIINFKYQIWEEGAPEKNEEALFQGSFTEFKKYVEMQDIVYGTFFVEILSVIYFENGEFFQIIIEKD